jgi:hypothetical protein
VDQLIQLAQEDARETEGLRVGQAFYNRLADVRPDLAGDIRGTALDPFYNGITPELIAVLDSIWGPA